MLAIVDGTIVTHTAHGIIADGVPIPEDLQTIPVERLRLLRPTKAEQRAASNDGRRPVGKLVDIGTNERTFYIDELGRLQAEQLDKAWTAVRATSSSRTKFVSRKWRVETEVEALDAARRRAEVAIDRAAARERDSRGSLSTVHLAKEDEARRYKAAGGDAADYPLLAASAEADDVTLGVAANRILKAAAAWREAQAGIERRRLGAKRAVRAAETAADISAAIEAFSAATDRAE